ncbi:MAG: RnfABCDGE type electron transport complex subunit D [Pseudomonadota bacterium]
MSNGTLTSSPHDHQRVKISHLMQQVLLACVPGLTALVFFFGWGTLINLVWLVPSALALESAAVWLRKRAVRIHLQDYSAVVTAVLLALALPPTLPWWLSLLGITIAIVIAKHLFGGLGNNPFNPAMTGYAVLLLLFPDYMTRWLEPAGSGQTLPGLMDSLNFFLGREPDAGFDAFTGATMLDSFREQHGANLFTEFWNTSPLSGQWSARGWEWVNAGFLMGGIFLLYKRIISWHIPVSLLAALTLFALVFHDSGSSQSLGSPLLHLFAGGTMLGAFFIATDPVTAATSRRGQLVYGAFIGAIIFAMRSWSSYPDGVAFAVLCGNAAVPLIDAFTRPRTFGRAP